MLPIERLIMKKILILLLLIGMLIGCSSNPEIKSFIIWNDQVQNTPYNTEFEVGDYFKINYKVNPENFDFSEIVCSQNTKISNLDNESRIVLKSAGDVVVQCRIDDYKSNTIRFTISEETLNNNTNNSSDINSDITNNTQDSAQSIEDNTNDEGDEQSDDFNEDLSNTSDKIYTIKEMSDIYYNNELDGNKQFFGKTVMVKGYFRDVQNNELSIGGWSVYGGMWIHIDGKKSVYDAVCLDMKDMEKSKISNFDRGQEIIFNGVVDGLDQEFIVFKKCEFLEY